MQYKVIFDRLRNSFRINPICWIHIEHGLNPLKKLGTNQTLKLVVTNKIAEIIKNIKIRNKKDVSWHGKI